MVFKRHTRALQIAAGHQLTPGGYRGIAGADDFPWALHPPPHLRLRDYPQNVCMFIVIVYHEGGYSSKPMTDATSSKEISASKQETAFLIDMMIGEDLNFFLNPHCC